MNFRSLMSLVLVFIAALVAGCASSAKMLPDGTWGIATTVGDGWDRSTTFVGEYDCPVKEGQPIIGKCTKSASALPPDRVHGQTVAGQVAVGVMGGTGAAVINGNTARSVAEKGQCKAGANCGTVITNQVQSVAEALNKNEGTVKVGVGSVPACAKTNSCGD